MALRAAFFDVGDTLVEHWAPVERMRELRRRALCAALGERDWYDAFLAAEIDPEVNEPAGGGWAFDPERARQETLEWFGRWFDMEGIARDGLDLEQVRRLHCVPLTEISSPVPGAVDALRWCKERGLSVVLVTNTLSRGDREVLEDCEALGVGALVDGVASSHSVGWRKPHPAIFERALEIAGVRPEEAFHVGDNLVADVWGADRLGIRTVWRRLAPADGALRPEVEPGAVVRDLQELPGAVASWLQ